MAQEPWKKAYQLSRARSTRPAARPAELRNARRPFWPWALAGVLLLFGAAGWYVWSERGVLVPRYAEQLPGPIAKTVEQAPLPVTQVDVAALDGGLGLGLAIGGNYLTPVEQTRDWGVEWRLDELGSGHIKLTTDGLTAYSEQGKLRSYKLDIVKVFADDKWQDWQTPLADAGLSPELNWRTATGDATMPSGVTEHVLVGRGGYEFAGQAAEAAYTLYFRDGWLTQVEAGLRTGAPVPLPPVVEPPLVPVMPDAPQPPADSGEGLAPPPDSAA